MYHSRVDWTPEKLERLRQGIEQEGLSAAMMAKEFFTSRSAVIGIAARQNIKFGKNPGRPREVKPSQPKPAATPRSKEATLKPQKVKAVKPKPKLKPQAPRLESEVPIWDLEQQHCRAVTNGDTFDAESVRYCGEKRVHGKSYCAHHAKMYNAGFKFKRDSGQNPPKYTPKKRYR